jgi:protein Tex
MQKIIRQIAAEIRVQEQQVRAAVDLLDGGATVPFVARYRKEATGGLDDIQLRELESRLGYLRELEDRREAVLRSIDEQGKLIPALRAAIEAAATKQELEDLYLPYKPKRRTKGQIAREAGLEPLADRLFNDPSLEPVAEAAAFVKPEKGEGGEDFATVAAVLDGVRDILSERMASVTCLLLHSAWCCPGAQIWLPSPEGPPLPANPLPSGGCRSAMPVSARAGQSAPYAAPDRAS